MRDALSEFSGKDYSMDLYEYPQCLEEHPEPQENIQKR